MGAFLPRRRGRHRRSRRYRRPGRTLRFAIAAAVLLLVAALAALGLQWRAAERKADIARAITGGEPQRAPALIRRYGCGGCHAIPGIDGADGQVGPPLAGLRQRVFVGGVARNTPDALVQWIVAPQRLSPRSAMPATGISDAEARDVAAYLYAQ